MLKTRRRRLGQAAAVAGGSIVVTLNVAQLDVTKMSASRTVLFSVSVDTLATGPCLPPRFPLVLTFLCNFSPLIAKSALRTVVAVTFQTSTTASSVLGNPVSALSNVAMMSILGLDECIFSDVDPLDPSVSPLGVAVGNELGQYYRGAVVAAIGMYLGSIGCSTALGVALAHVLKRPTLRPVFGKMRFPSNLMVVVGLLHQGMATSSVSLIRLAEGPGDVLLGIACRLSQWCGCRRRGGASAM